MIVKRLSKVLKLDFIIKVEHLYVDHVVAKKLQVPMKVSCHQKYTASLSFSFILFAPVEC